MAIVRTVLGDRDSRDLGFSHCHEHLFVYPVNGVELAERLIIDDYEKSRSELLHFRETGGATVVDAQPFGSGRHPELLARAAKETGINIIASTGLHRRHYYPADFWMYRAGVDELAELFLSEIVEGMYAYDPLDPFSRRTAVRAGIIKIATGAEGLDSHCRKVFEAAARAYRESGAPVMTHTELSTWGAQQAHFLMERGVDAASIIISHMDRAADSQQNLELARLGVFLEYDTIARHRYHSDREEVELIRRMVRAGFGNSILLGLDVTRDRLPAYGGSYGLTYLSESFLPLLRARGIEQAAVEAMMVSNPARALALRKRNGSIAGSGGNG